MSDIVKILPYCADLDDTIKKTELHTIFVMSESMAHRFEIEVKKGGKAVALSGMTVTASFTNFREETTIEMAGAVKDGKAVVTLSKPCYKLRGQFIVCVQVKNGDADTAVFLGEGHMRTSRAEKIVYDDYVVYDVDTLLSQIEAMKTATTNAQNATKSANTAAGNATAATTNANNAAAKINGMTVSATKGTDAVATVSEKNGVKHIAFTLPKGDKGDRGEKGETGSVENMPFYEGTPAAPGTASTGSSDRVSRGDHVHPFPKRIKHASSNAYAELRQLSGDRTKSVGVIDPDTGEEVDLYVDRGTGNPTVRSKFADVSAVFHILYSTLNKPSASDVGALPITGGTVTGKIKTQQFVIGNSTEYPGVEFETTDVAKGKVGAIQFTATDTGRRFSLVHYPANQDGKSSKAFESFQFPQPDQNLAESKYYNVLTTKVPVTIAQGGTGKTTAAEALAALGGVPTGRTINGKALTGNVTLSPADIGGFVGCHEITVASDDGIAAGSTGTGTATFTAISGASRYYVVMCTTGSMWGIVTNVSISGTTLTATFYNNSTGTHTVQSKFLVIGVK